MRWTGKRGAIMARNEIFTQFIDYAYVYRFTHGPNLIQSKEQARRDGINCVSLAHLALRELCGVYLPSTLMCSELHRDREHFEAVSDIEIKVGDLVWFGVQEPVIEPNDFVPIYINGELLNWREYPVKHVAIATGEVDGENDPLLLHSSSIVGTNAVWPMRDFANHRRYERKYGVSRLKI